MRSDLELLNLLLERLLSKYFCASLCFDAVDMKNNNVITQDEYVRLKNIIFENDPGTRYGMSNFYWEPFAKEPRIEFVKMIIEKYS